MLKENTIKVQNIINCIVSHPMATAKEIVELTNEKVSTVNIVRSRIGWNKHKSDFYNDMVRTKGQNINFWREKFNKNYKIKEKNRYIREKQIKISKKRNEL